MPRLLDDLRSISARVFDQIGELLTLDLLPCVVAFSGLFEAALFSLSFLEEGTLSTRVSSKSVQSNAGSELSERLAVYQQLRNPP